MRRYSALGWMSDYFSNRSEVIYASNFQVRVSGDMILQYGVPQGSVIIIIIIIIIVIINLLGRAYQCLTKIIK